MTLDEQARALAAQIFRDHGQWLHDGTSWHYADRAAPDIASALTAAEAAGFARGLKDAAYACQSIIDHANDHSADVRYNGQADGAQACLLEVRALIDQPATVLVRP
jgi:hypothetical protein